MSEAAEFSIHYNEDEAANGDGVIVMSGTYLVCTIAGIDDALRAIDENISIIDMSQVVEIDTVGAWVACRIADKHSATIIGASERAQRLIDAVKDMGNEAELAPPLGPIWERVPRGLGAWVVVALAGLMGIVGFLGNIVSGFAGIVRHPSRFRGRALVHQIELVGVDALPIIGLMSFLIGIVIAQQGAVQLAQFGAETLTINLVGRITLRELGTLMTAIMVAGRSGSAFAAQIGTMKLTEEVDAMRTIGISPIEALVIPRVMAAVMMMPLLAIYASVMAVIGGAVVGDLILGIPFWTFLERIKDVVPIFDLWVGLIKAVVFGLLIALAGCYHGLQVRGDSAEVGKRTTLAVVSAIFAVIVLDAFFAVFFTEIGWG